MTAAFPHVAVLMATYNGAKFLPQQLASLAAQTHKNWDLWASDDGSTDATLDILRRCQENWGPEKLHILRGPQKGFQHNFLCLTAREDISADYYAWSDQDDIWLPTKLARALNCLGPLGSDQPALYGGRAILTDRADRDYGRSPIMNRRPPGFANALVENLAGGNTMVFNQKARELIVAEYPFEIAFHDWWAYLVVSGCGGRMIYDPEPQIRYRQHGDNLIGHKGCFNPLRYVKNLLAGKFKRYVSLNLAALQKIAFQLTSENSQKLEAFILLRRLNNPLRRLTRFQAGTFHRQTALRQAAACLAVMLGKV